jgi:hypothetical protein
MSQLFTIGKEISMRLLRDYVIEHKVNRGDTIVLHPLNYEHILDEIRNSGESIPVPINILGVLLVKDTTDLVDTGKIQIIKNENLNQ